MVEVELLEGLSGREAGVADAHLAAAGVTGDDVALEEVARNSFGVQPSARAHSVRRVTAPATFGGEQGLVLGQAAAMSSHLGALSGDYHLVESDYDLYASAGEAGDDL